MKFTSAALFATGYVIGARAGRERYAQILSQVAKTSQRLEQFSARRPPPLTTPTAGGPIAPPDHANRLSQGILLQGTILGRVFGLRLLRLDTTVTILPADMRRRASQPEQRPLAPPLDLKAAFTRSVAPKHSLSEAVQAIQQSRELLAQARENRLLGSTNLSNKAFARD